jgi:hypothetical protein
MKTKNIILATTSYLAIITESLALKLNKTNEMSNALGMTGDIATDGTNLIDNGLIYGGWGIIVASIFVAGMGVIKAVLNAQSDKPSVTWTMSKAIVFGVVVIVIGVLIGATLLAFAK